MLYVIYNFFQFNSYLFSDSNGFLTQNIDCSVYMSRLYLYQLSYKYDI